MGGRFEGILGKLGALLGVHIATIVMSEALEHFQNGVKSFSKEILLYMLWVNYFSLLFRNGAMYLYGEYM